MNEWQNTILLGGLVALGGVYLTYKVEQDRARLRRIIGVLDSEQSFDLDYLLSLADGGSLQPGLPRAMTAPSA